MALLMDDVILPVQYFALSSPQTFGTRLCRAVLLQAIEDLETGLRGRSRAAVHLRAKTMGWFRSTDESPFSFIYVCHALGLEPSVLRRGILSWAAQVVKGTAPTVSIRQYIT